MRHVSDEELEGFEKRELLELAQKYRRRIGKIKESEGAHDERVRAQLMLVLSAEAAELAAACAKGAASNPHGLEDGEVDRRVRHLREIHEELVACRGETFWSREEGVS